MYLLILSLLLILGFFLVIFCSHKIVNYACILSNRLSVSKTFIGMSLIGFGTSFPELITAFLANIKGNDDLVLSNIIGSNLFNVLFVIGFCSLIFPIKISKDKQSLHSLYYLISATVILFLLSLNQILSFIDSLFLFSLLILILYISFKKEDFKKEDLPSSHKTSYLKLSVFLVASFLGLYIGGELILDSSLKIADFFNLSEALIGLFLISIGTSIPELFTSLSAYLKKENQMLFSSIIGSNLFNSLGVTGFAGLFNPIFINSKISFTHLPIMFVLSLLAFFMCYKLKVFSRIYGLFFLLIYFSYCLFSFYHL